MHVEQEQIRARRFPVLVGLLNEADSLFAVPRYMQNMIEALIPESDADDADIRGRILSQQNLVWRVSLAIASRPSSQPGALPRKPSPSRFTTFLNHSVIMQRRRI